MPKVQTVVLHAPDPMRPRNIPRERDLDGPDALPIGTGPTVYRPYAGLTPHIGFGIDEGREMYRIRNRPELYPDWMRDMAEDYRASVAHAQDLWDWDCHTCQHAVMTPGLRDRCPWCWAK